jgi:hypothetical protein
MWAAQFRPPSPPRRARTPPPTPPHPLQMALPSALQYPFIEDRHTFLANRQIPVTPPPSSISSDSSNSLGSTFSNDPMIVAGNDIRVHPGEWTQWDQLLYYFAQGRNMGRWAQDYLPFIAIAPEYLPTDIRTPAWLLEQIRMDVPSDLIKLRPGSAVCLQDLSLRDSFYAPAIPTMLGVIDRMLWHEEGYQIASVGTHVYSPSGYDVQFESFCFIAIPISFVDPAFYLPRVDQRTLGQTIINDEVYPPIRDWGRMGASWRVCDVRNILEEERSAAVRDWVEEQASIQWF